MGCGRARGVGAWAWAKARAYGPDGLEAWAGDAVLAIGGFFDVNQGDLDAAAALGGGGEGGDIHVVGDAEAEIVVIQTEVGYQRVGGIVGEAGPDAGVEVDGGRLIGRGGSGPGATEYVLAGSGLVADEAADIDGTGGSGEREEAAAVDRLTDRDVDGVHAKEGGLGAIEVVGGGAEVEVIVAIGG